MMASRAIVVALVLTLTIAPAAIASPLVTGGSIFFRNAWHLNGAGGTCAETALLQTTQVGWDLAVHLHSGTRAAGQSVSTTPIRGECPLQVSIEPGVLPNPCAIMEGEAAAPALDTDPFFHIENYVWTKRAFFSDGGYVVHQLAQRYYGYRGELSGSCFSPPNAHATWSALVDTVAT